MYIVHIVYMRVFHVIVYWDGTMGIVWVTVSLMLEFFF